MTVPFAVGVSTILNHPIVFLLLVFTLLQAAITGLREGLVDLHEGDPQLMPAPGEKVPKVGFH